MSLIRSEHAPITLDDVAGDDDLLDADVVLPDAPPDRPRVLLIGSALASAGVVMAFATLIGIYLAARQSAVAAGHEWIKSGTFTLTGPNIALFTLLLSLVTMQWAVYSAGNSDRQNTWVAVGLTVMLGAAYINATTFIYTEMGLAVRETSAALLIYTVTGAHLVVMGAAMLFVLVAAFRTLGAQDSAPAREGMAAAAMFWYVTCAVFFVIWYAIYVIK
jgi:heme/copper-type cytochrome/quinol oxidase subunit 3